jgi:two-component system sensor kinase FixL
MQPQELIGETMLRRLAGGAAGGGFFFVDAEARVRGWSESAQRLFGHVHDAVVGQPLTLLCPFVGDAETDGWCRRADGTRFWGQVVIVGDRGTEHLAPLLVVDSGRPPAARAAAAPAGPLLSPLFDLTGDGLVLLDAVGRIAAVNAAVAAMFRRTREELVGAPWQTLFDLPPERLPVSGTFHDLGGRRHDGSLFPLSCTFSTADGQPALVLRDLSERRLLERQVFDVSEQLRRQIGQDLHDGLGQLLTGTAFLAKGIESHVGAAYQPQARRVVELINQAIQRVRGLARGLSPIHVEAQGLEAVLRHVLAESAKLLGVECLLEVHDPVETDRPATLAQLCLIVREAITNAVRHGRARRIVLRLMRQKAHQETQSHAQSLLIIEDDGAGLGEGPPREGLGLRSMRRRAALIGGTLELGRGAEGGTVVRCSWSE